MPEPTPNLHAANTGFHKEVGNRPVTQGRTNVNAPPLAWVCDVRDVPHRSGTTCENGWNPAPGAVTGTSPRGRDHRRGARTRARTPVSHGSGAPREPRRLTLRGDDRQPRTAARCGYFTGKWYATRYRSAGITTSAVSTARPEA
ncbi:hypothetical protein ACE1SV_21260 [Streptomyces sennicomposti]